MVKGSYAMLVTGLAFQLISFCSYGYSLVPSELSNPATNQTTAFSKKSRNNSRLEENILSIKEKDAAGFFVIGTLAQTASTIALIGAYRLKEK
ncbi:hypothetical protein J4466_04930 [Candidatus Pacearchaeota archaeon]|nr:hypothetical protein [Candidatus Pacearchaeota archaeon]